MAELVAAVVGGVLAAGTGWFLQARLEESRITRTKELLVVGLSDDLKNAVELYDKVMDEWEKGKIVWFTTLNELRESRYTFTNHKDWMVLFKDAELRHRIFRYYHRSTDHLKLLENQQQQRYAIQAKLEDTIRDIRLRSPDLTREQAAEQAIGILEAEDMQVRHIDEALPAGVAKLRDFKTEAERLLSLLQAKKVKAL